MFYVWNIALAPLLASPDPGVAATNMMLVPYCKRVFGKFNKTQGCNSQSKRPITEVQLWLRLGTNRQAPAAPGAPGGSAPVCPLHIRLGAFTSSVPLFFARIHPPLPCGGHLARRSRCPATPRGQILACRSRPVTDDGGFFGAHSVQAANSGCIPHTSSVKVVDS